MICQANKTGSLIPAAVYIRMSTEKQDKSPEQQRVAVKKLAADNRYGIVVSFDDPGITGDSSVSERPGLAALLAAAKAGKFKVVLAWHTSRISRESDWDAVAFYNALCKAGVHLVHTCQEGLFDLNDQVHRLRLSLSQDGNHKHLGTYAKETLRGKIDAVKRGEILATCAIYGMDRGEFDPTGTILLRRLQPGQRKGRQNQVRWVPSDNPREHAGHQIRF